MAGCPYSDPTKKDVLYEMTKAYRILDCYLEIFQSEAEELPPIYLHLRNYINELRTQLKG